MAKQLPQNRSLLKGIAKMSLSGRLLRSFLACILPILPLKILSLATASAGAYIYVGVYDLVFGFAKLPWSLLLSVVLVRLLAANPMQVKTYEYFLQLLENPKKKISPLMVCECFNAGYLKRASAMLLLDLITLLSALLPMGIQLLLPGMITTAEYSGQMIPVLSAYPFGLLLGSVLMVICTLIFSQVPFVLATRPELGIFETYKEALRLTRGRLLELFILRLSFFGWMILDSITIVAGIFYYPYLYATQAAYFLSFTGKEIPGPVHYVSNPAAFTASPFFGNGFESGSEDENIEDENESSEDSEDEN